MKNDRIIPPRLPLKILRTFLRDAIAEEVTGDLEEKFYKTLSTSSSFKAKLNYWYQVFHYARPFAMKKYEHLNLCSTTMYKSYFKFGWRNISRHKTYSAINICGLAIGLACCIAIALYIADEYSHDRFHSSSENIYRVVNRQKMGDNFFNIASTPGPLGSALKSDFQEVERFCRVGQIKSAGILQYQSSVIEPRELLQVDNNFFNVFDFGMIQGNPRTALQLPDEVVITETFAAKLFGADWKNSVELIGTQIIYNDNRILTLAGITYDPPANSHIQFDVLLSLRYEEIHSEYYGWNSNNYHTYILLSSKVDAYEMDKKISNYLDKYISDESEIELSLQPLTDIYLFSNFDFQTDWSKTGNILYVKVFIGVGLIVLLIAVSNYVNLSTARATRRAKEFGVRKVVGASKTHLVAQFLTESFIITAISTAMALIIVQLSLPLLNDISAKNLRIPFDEFRFVVAISVFVATVSFVSGVYPAIQASNLLAGVSMRGLFARATGHSFRRVLVVCQFTLSVVLIVGTIVISQQMKFLQEKDLGFDKDQLLYIGLKNELPAKSQIIKADLLDQTSISAVSIASNNLVNVVRSTGGIGWEGKTAHDKILMTHMNVDHDFLVTTGMTLAAGRYIDPDIASDTISAYLINETAARNMGWTPDSAIGKKLSMWEEEGEVIGVVKDFHFRPMTETINPFLFRYRPKEKPSGLFVKTKPHRVADAISSIEAILKHHDPKSVPFYQFVDDDLEKQYRTEQNTGRIIFIFSVLAIFVACLGLFGLATFTTEQRLREVGVRKVLGASVASIVKLLSRDFLTLVAFAVIISVPLGWWAIGRWLENFAYRIDLEWWMFIMAGIVAIAIASFTISFQSISAARTNPAKTLRSE